MRHRLAGRRHDAVLASYLAVWFAVSAIPIGALGVLFTAYLVRGGWTHDMAQPLGRAALLTPVAGVLFIPVLIGMGAIYPWAADARVVAAVQGSLPDAVVLRAAHHHLFRDLDRARGVGASRVWRSSRACTRRRRWD